MLYPIFIHSDFKEKVWIAVKERLQSKAKTVENSVWLEESAARWSALCGNTGGG
jgi:hypothetical protein